MCFILLQLIEEEDGEKELTELQREIDMYLERDNFKKKKIASVLDSLSNVGMITKNLNLSKMTKPNQLSMFDFAGGRLR